MPIVVLLGTGTDVGKTYVTLELARELERQRPNALVTALKPVESGYLPDAPSDAGAFDAARSNAVRPIPHPLYAFRDAVSPHLAARRAALDAPEVGRIRAWIHAVQAEMLSVATAEVWLLVETAGAAFSPLADGLTNADLALALEPSLWVLIAPDSLGVLHDVTTTLATLESRARAPDALVLSASRQADASTGTNAAELRFLKIADPAAALGRGDSDVSDLARVLVQRSLAVPIS